MGEREENIFSYLDVDKRLESNLPPQTVTDMTEGYREATASYLGKICNGLLSGDIPTEEVTGEEGRKIYFLPRGNESLEYFKEGNPIMIGKITCIYESNGELRAIQVLGKKGEDVDINMEVMLTGKILDEFMKTYEKNK